MGKHYGWGDEPEGQQSHFAAEEPDTPKYSAYGEFNRPGVPSSPSVSSHSSGQATFAVASSLLHKVPGAKTFSLFNATVLGLLGVGAALAAWAGGSAMLLGLLARWYLPAKELQYNLPLYFDYAAGPAAAGAWLPLLRQTPLTATLTPPTHQQPPSAAGLNVQGNIAPGGGGSFSFTSGGGSSPAGGAGGFGSQLGFLGLGFGPGSRAAAKQSGRGWFGRSRTKQKQQQSTNGFLRGVDVGSGLMVPEADWLVPSWGRMKLSIKLEMPPACDSNLVQVTSELVSQQGIVLGRSSRTWLPKPQPLLYRIADVFICGPWRALGLLDNTLTVSLGMFDGFQNPQPPPGGWGSVHGLTPGKTRVTECTAQGGSAADAGADAASGGMPFGQADVAEVSGPRAMWLRVTLIERGVGFGPPKVYRANAKLELKLSFWDRVAVALRPSLPTMLLLLVLGIGLAVGGTGTAVVLLLLAYSLYRWASNNGQPEQQQQQQRYKGGTPTAAAAATAAPEGAMHGGELQDEASQASAHSAEEGYYEPAYETEREIEEFSDGLEGLAAAAAESRIQASGKVSRAFSPASFDGGSQQDADDDPEYTSRQQQQQQDEALEHARPQQQQQQQGGKAAVKQGGGGGAFNSIMHMLGYAAGGGSSSAASGPTAAAAAASGRGGGDGSDEWQEQLLAQSDDEQQQQQLLYNDDVIDMPTLHKAGSYGAPEENAESSETAAGQPCRRAGYSYHM